MIKYIAIAFFFAVSVSACAFVKWETFRSPNAFSVDYPTTWHRIGISTDRLDIRSAGDGAEGVVIKRGQGEISVVEEPKSSEKTLAEVISHYTSGAVIISRQRFANKVIDERGCHDLVEFVVKEPSVPPEDSPIKVPNFIFTEIFCEIDGHTIVTILKNFEGDPAQRRYQNVAAQIAMSARILP